MESGHGNDRKHSGIYCCSHSMESISLHQCTSFSGGVKLCDEMLRVYWKCLLYALKGRHTFCIPRQIIAAKQSLDSLSSPCDDHLQISGKNLLKIYRICLPLHRLFINMPTSCFHSYDCASLVFKTKKWFGFNPPTTIRFTFSF